MFLGKILAMRMFLKTRQGENLNFVENITDKEHLLNPIFYSKNREYLILASDLKSLTIQSLQKTHKYFIQSNYIMKDYQSNSNHFGKIRHKNINVSIIYYRFPHSFKFSII